MVHTPSINTLGDESKGFRQVHVSKPFYGRYPFKIIILHSVSHAAFYEKLLTNITKSLSGAWKSPKYSRHIYLELHSDFVYVLEHYPHIIDRVAGVNAQAASFSNNRLLQPEIKIRETLWHSEFDCSVQYFLTYPTPIKNWDELRGIIKCYHLRLDTLLGKYHLSKTTRDLSTHQGYFYTSFDIFEGIYPYLCIEFNEIGHKVFKCIVP